jgi:hypothetical protein
VDFVFLGLLALLIALALGFTGACERLRRIAE